MKRCPDCNVEPGELHRHYCDTAHCTDTGEQRIMCDHNGTCPSRWNGDRVGIRECQEWGWYAVFQPGSGWATCTKDTPGARPDLNRVLTDTRWSPMRQRFVRH